MRALALVVCAGLSSVGLAGASLAQESEQPPRYGSGGEERVGSPFSHLTSPASQQIVLFLRRSEETCGWLDPRYRVDCLRIVFADMAARLPRTGDYAPVRDALDRAAGGLDRLVRQNLDPGAASLRLSVGNRPAARRLPDARPVRPEATQAVLRAADAVVAEAASVLLRSAENSERRRLHYQEIAAAIDSTKVLLRSS